jgi:hypothetical protein
MFLHTEQIEPKSGYRLFVRFNSGVSGEVSLADELWGEMFELLKDESLFMTAQQDSLMKTVVWANGADLTPESLLELMIRQTERAA